MSAKNNSDLSRKDKKTNVREVQSSQRDKHCVTETPEGENISLVKYFATTCRLSLDTEESEPLNYIKDFVGNEGEKKMGEICSIGLMLNGKFTSFPEVGVDVVFVTPSTREKLIYGKTHGELKFDIEIIYDKLTNTIQVFTDASRPMSPYFVVNRKTRKLVIDEVNGWELSYKDLIRSGCVEFLTPRESDYEDVIVSYSIEHFYDVQETLKNYQGDELVERLKFTDYSYCNIDPNQIFGVTGSVSPFSDRQNTTRNLNSSVMAKQALGYYNINYHEKTYGSREGFKRLYRATRTFCETDVYFLPKMDLFPAGQTAVLAFLPDPDNQEDSVVISEDFVNSGNLNYFKYIMIKYVQPSFPVGIKEILEKPPPKKNESAENYAHIDDSGLPKLDAYVREGDCIIGKVLKSKDGTITNNSLYCGLGEEGYVDRVIKTREKDQGNLYIKIKLRIMRKYQAGDKLALRYSQKGTVGRVEKRENMVRVASGPNKGMTPDVIFNPLGYPSRQTVGLLLEGVVTKNALYTGERVNVSAFHGVKVEDAYRSMESMGMDPYCYEEMEFPDGTPLKSKVVFCPLYEQVLRHQVVDKYQVRSSGNKSLYTHQPRGGRAQRGGQKIGEMEKDSFVAHGASEVIVERMMKVSDEFKITVCQSCGIIINKKNCTLCDNSKPGILTVPYVFKLLIHLLNGVGLDIRIKTKKVSNLEK